ncbi:L-lysine 2-3-aminomutase, partial [Penicillium rubens]
VWKIGLPVRSAVLKPHAGELVVGWVTTSESSLLVWKTGLPVRSAVLKPHAGELVVGWVTTSESSLLLGRSVPHWGLDSNNLAQSEGQGARR